MRLKDKSAIVTGGGSGFGEGIVRKFVAGGARVLIADRDEANAKRVAEAMGAQWLRADVSRAVDVAAMVGAAVERFGALDVLVNNAGIYGEPTGAADYDLAEARAVIETNVFGPWRMIQATLPRPLGYIERPLPHLVDSAASFSSDGDFNEDRPPIWATRSSPA